MDEVYFHLQRHLEYFQVQWQWCYSQTRQVGHAWSSTAWQQLDTVRSHQLLDQIKLMANAVKAAFIRASTVLAQPAEMYNQLYELIRVEMPIIYPGSAGFVTGAVIGLIIGLSIQHTPPPQHRMRAVVCLAYDGLDSLSYIEDLVVPSVVQKNQILVQVKASSVDVVDIRICGGYGRLYRRLFGSAGPNMKFGFPVTLGRDCSGIVAEIGPGVQGIDVGDEVWAVVPFWASGTLSEFVLLTEDSVAKKPQGVGFEGAASLPYAGCLAYSACLRAGIVGELAHGKRVLIQSGVSPVGCIASQLARVSGCEVTVTCSALGAPVARALGAEHVVTYGQLDMEDQLTKDRFDVVVNTVGGVSMDACAKLCKPEGVVVSTVPAIIPSDNYAFPISYLFGLYLRTKAVFHRLTGRPSQWTEVEFSSAVLEKLGELVNEGKIHPVVDKIFAPQDALLALQHCDSANAIGKTIIRFRTQNDRKKIPGMYVTSL